MNKQQEENCLRWIGHMLSGSYRFGRGYLFDVANNCHCGLGVAAESKGFKPNSEGDFVLGALFGPSSITVPVCWFREIFGLRERPLHYSQINDDSENYLPLCRAVLHELPDSREKRHYLAQCG